MRYPDPAHTTTMAMLMSKRVSISHRRTQNSAIDGYTIQKSPRAFSLSTGVVSLFLRMSWTGATSKEGLSTTHSISILVVVIVLGASSWIMVMRPSDMTESGDQSQAMNTRPSTLVSTRYLRIPHSGINVSELCHRVLSWIRR